MIASMGLSLLFLLLLAASPVQAQPQSTARAADAAWERFPVLLWRGTRDDEESLELARALGGALVIGAGPAPEDLPFLVFNAAGRDALHLDEETPGLPQRRARWIETREDDLLVRRPCLTDPATRAELAATLRSSLAARAGDWGLGLSLGDEVSLTPNGSPGDVCLSATCRAAWLAFLESRPELDDADRARYADLAAASTDAARAALSEGATRDLEPWLLRREFHAQVVSQLVLELADLARAQRGAGGEAPVGLLGLVGRTAFGGVDLDDVVPGLDFAEAYAVSQAREELYTLRPPGLRVLQTVFPAHRTPDRAAWHAFEHWLRGGDGLVVWSDRELRASPAARARIERAVDDLRAIRREVGTYAPRPAGVALVHSDASVALAWLREALLDGPTWPNRLQGAQERDGAREVSLRNWLRLLEDLGLMPGALSIEDVEATTAARFGVLVLHQLAVLDESDLDRLRAYLGAGGVLVVEGDLGWIDTRGRQRAKDPREGLRELAPRRVLDAPALVGDYLRLRASEPARARALREAWWSRLPDAGVERAPFDLSCEVEALPWLRAWVPGSGAGEVLCVALPNLPNATPIDLRPTVLATMDVEWLHPAELDPDGQRVLPAGDAAVFRLLPPR